MIRLRLHLEKVNKARIFTDNGGRKCLAFILLDPIDQEQRGRVAHSLSPEQRAAGQKGEICGSWCTVGTAGKPAGRAKGGLSK
jgi:hypothetical protein